MKGRGIRRPISPSPSPPAADARARPATTPRRDEAHHRRQTAARAYQPAHIRLLLLTEAPPSEPDRYFYFEAAAPQESVFENVCAVLFEERPAGNTRTFLKALRRRGVFAIELRPDEASREASLQDLAKWLPLRIEPLAPEHVVVIGAPVYRAALAELERAKLPVVKKAVPAPAPGHERDFTMAFRSALVVAGLEKLIKPLTEAERRAGAAGGSR